MAELFPLGRVMALHMIATFLKTVDGGFDYGRLIALFVISLTFPVLVRMFYGMVKTGRLPGSRGRGMPTYWVERAKTPIAFWIFFVFYCLGTSLILFGLTAVCFGWHFRHP